MKNVQKIDLGLTGYDELFMNDAERKENKLPRIYDVPISEIDDFPDHPFKVKIDEDMDQLVQSIKERGIITPVTLRPKEDGRYEIVSGHRRKKACELAGLDTVKAEVREMTRDEAIILMVESNLQRSTILPSEKAFSYKMRLEAMKRQAGRPSQENYSPLGNNSLGTKSSDEMAEEVGESKNTIFRYIRLTELIPELLQLVDESRIAFRPAVELSYLKKEEQSALLEEMYEVRHDDDQQGDPVQIANWIMVNHWGTLITNKPIRLEPSERINNAYRDIDPEEDWNYEGSTATVKEYMEKNPPAVHKEKEHEPTR